MMTAESTILYLVIASQALLLAAACIALLKFQRQFRAIEDFWNSPTGAMLADDQQQTAEVPDTPAQPYIMTVGTEEALLEKLKLDQRVNELQRKLNELVERQDEQKSVPAIEFERSLPIEHALRMAKNGASVDDLTRTCGLNIGEARLLKKLHGQAAA